MYRTLILVALLFAVSHTNCAPPKDCLHLDFENARAGTVGDRWKLIVGNLFFLDFDQQKDEAIQASSIIRHYRMDEQCFVGRPAPSMTYYLTAGQAPVGPMEAEDCLGFRRENLSVKEIGGGWQLVDGTSWILHFAGERNEAELSLDIIQRYGFDRVCYVGRPQPSMTYFRKSGDNVQVTRPLPNERFAAGESIAFEARVNRESAQSATAVEWSSSLDGPLGSGATLSTSSLSTGTHIITTDASGLRKQFPLRVLGDLWELYQAFPSSAEIERILAEIDFRWEDGTGADESWSPYDSFAFDQSSTDPSKLAAVAKVDVLRHQGLAESLPFAEGASAYENLTSHVDRIVLRLDCNVNTGGGRSVRLNRNWSVWDARRSGTPQDPEACKTSFANPSLFGYQNGHSLIVHEARHSEPGDPGHTICNGRTGMDSSLQEGSGYAWAALYLMWVYKYGLYDPPSIKNEARNAATSLLNDRFCTPPAHSDPRVQMIIDELLQN